MRRRRLKFYFTLIIIFYFLIRSLDGVDARGKKKKKRPAGGGSSPTCASLGLDCSDTCCTGEECADTKLDCAQIFKRPFIELYIGFGTIIGIIIIVSLSVCIGNFCLVHKFCQHYDEGSDCYIGGFSLCDALACLLTCGLTIWSTSNENSSK